MKLFEDLQRLMLFLDYANDAAESGSEQPHEESSQNVEVQNASQ